MKHSIPVVIAKFSVLAILLCGCDARHPQQKPDDSEPAAASSFFYGQPIAEVQRLLGEPNGTVTVSNQTILLYGRETLKFIDGKWVNPQPDIRERIEAYKKAAAKQAKANKSKPTKTVEINSLPATAAKTQAAAAPAEKSGAGLYSGLLVPGKITVVDFYADWCGPCKQMAPVLDKLVSGKSDVVLKKIDIVNWDSAVAKKYDITSIPNVRVFDKQGRMVGSPTSDPNQVARHIELARAF
jgi:thiol-disulfide isomerase/thioredoxin